MTLLFADVRGSTTLAGQMSASEFTRLMNRFYTATNQVLTKTDAFIDKLVGDEIIGHYIPGFCGPGHASLAIKAAQELLHAPGTEQKRVPGCRSASVPIPGWCISAWSEMQKDTSISRQWAITST
jgi:adenylate cyclase